jgi:hypothetical protein
MSATASALGDCLRARREQIRPEDVGLNSGPRRRVPGLRREELAMLAGISVDYYLRLEGTLKLLKTQQFTSGKVLLYYQPITN